MALPIAVILRLATALRATTAPQRRSGATSKQPLPLRLLADLKKLLHRFTWKPEAARYVRHWSGRGQNTGIHFMEMDV